MDTGPTWTRFNGLVSAGSGAQAAEPGSTDSAWMNLRVDS
jgi:hypothetical protein